VDLGAVFREHAGQVTSTLTRAMGTGQLQLVENAVQDAFLTAMQRWPDEGVPDNPAGWLLTVARNRAIDQLRREKLKDDKSQTIRESLSALPTAPDDDARLRSELLTDELTMMFVCCHPALADDARIALTLRALCGMDVEQIAGAFLDQPETVKKRLSRARARVREAGVSFSLPSPVELGARLGVVLDVLYLLFSEGYAPHSGARAVQGELCADAIRLTKLLLAHERTDTPRARALLALMLLQASRLDARFDDEGHLLSLQEQDRSRWNRAMIAEGLAQLGASASGDVVTPTHLEAAIAACHARAPRWEDTDWPQLLGLYDQLLALNPSSVVELNRAVALGLARGPLFGLEALHNLRTDPKMDRYFRLHVAFADFFRQLGERGNATDAYERALALADTDDDRQAIRRKLAAL
jgi:RNA polymerase sigma-70 factor (ECF subfamily)